MRAGGQDGEAVLGRDRGDGPAQMAQLGARLRHVGVRRRDHLDLRLQEFARDPAVGRGSRGLEERLRHVVRDQLGLGVDQEVFLFDSEGEFVGHSLPLLDRLAPR